MTTPPEETPTPEETPAEQPATTKGEGLLEEAQLDEVAGGISVVLAHPEQTAGG